MPPTPASPSPPRRTFPFALGSFDFPRASNSPLPEPPVSGDDYTSTQRSQDAPTEDHDDSLLSQRRPRVELRRRQLRRTFPLASESEPGVTDALSRRPPPPVSDRRRATPSERYLRRSYARSREFPSFMEFSSDVLDSLRADPHETFSTGHSSIRPRSPGGDLNSSRRQTKRRKLGHDTTDPATYDRYGYKGQVVPGRLKMDILSFDGGEFERYGGQSTYSVQNVLRNDKSVYCSESSRCNLLLKHKGEVPFCLERIVIRAPDRGFDAPLQEGLIFVSMSSDNLLSGTSGYKITYDTQSAARSPTPDTDPAGEQQLSLQEAMEDSYIWENSRNGGPAAMEEQIERLRLRSRRLQVGSSTRPSLERPREEHQRASREDDTIDNCEYPANESYATAGISAPTPPPPPFTITTESDDDMDESEDQTSAAVMADRMRRERRWRADSDGEDGMALPQLRRAYYPFGPTSENYEGRHWRTDRFLDPIRAARLHAPSRIEAKDDLPDPDGLIPPHARFYIAKHKNKITIKFHPAVSGKYVLLKLWSPTHDGNIDIETVQFYGYSGPRFFPALQLR